MAVPVEITDVGEILNLFAVSPPRQLDENLEVNDADAFGYENWLTGGHDLRWGPVLQ